MTQFNITGSVYSRAEHAESVFIWILCIIEIPVVLLTLFALCFLIKSNRAASVYVIQLILSDLLQIILVLISTTQWESRESKSAYKYCLIVGLYFIACIAIERYLLVSYPIWYRIHHSVKFSSFICFIIWLVPLIFARIKNHTLKFHGLSQCLAYFIPYPIILLCFVGTWRGLSHTTLLTSHKRKLILGSLFLVVLNYTFLILPNAIKGSIKFFGFSVSQRISNFFYCLWYLNPFVDCLLYCLLYCLFVRSDVDDILAFLYCCSGSDRHQNTAQRATSTSTHQHNVQ